MRHRKAVYDADLPRKMYAFFVGYEEAGSAPSFQKFARASSLTLDELEAFRRHKPFERAYRACREIRRDYLIDKALCKRFDSSMVKFLLSCEFSMGEDKDADNELSVTLEVPT